MPSVFAWLREAGVADADMLDTFNCGVGMVVAMPADETLKALDFAEQHGHEAWVVGEVVGATTATPCATRGLWS